MNIHRRGNGDIAVLARQIEIRHAPDRRRIEQPFVALASIGNVGDVADLHRSDGGVLTDFDVATLLRALAAEYRG